MASLLASLEHVVKKPVWDCRMCGQCVLHSTGLTCPMTCPKQLRNGPCGGVREDGACEVDPTMRCVWLKARERGRWLPRRWREEVDELRAPVDNQLWGTSSWANLFTGRDRVTPPGWDAGAETDGTPDLAPGGTNDLEPDWGTESAPGWDTGGTPGWATAGAPDRPGGTEPGWDTGTEPGWDADIDLYSTNGTDPEPRP